MTSPDSPPARTPTIDGTYTDGQLVWRWIASLLALVASAIAALAMAIVGVIVTTGCFIECSDPDASGVLLLMGASGILGGGIALNSLWWPRQRRRWLRAGIAAAVIALVFLVYVASQPHPGA